ncbi:hypothetical protein AVEN_164883-1 [Araneus ventricosus]|uniref:Uncharacterized protein n=1 Tax=Araneus ventricosus TaxID=182803 RepID=A0A4Y2DWA5_ARAVE|nr:hypothetical protein AVEN_164883-1 [Araneus ventricosus]
MEGTRSRNTNSTSGVQRRYVCYHKSAKQRHLRAAATRQHNQHTTPLYASRRGTPCRRRETHKTMKYVSKDNADELKQHNEIKDIENVARMATQCTAFAQYHEIRRQETKHAP